MKTRDPLVRAAVGLLLPAASLLAPASAGGQETRESGFRVQVFASSDVAAAEARAVSLHEELGGRYAVYLNQQVYESYEYTVQVGDFPIVADAREALGEVWALGYGDALTVGVEPARTLRVLPPVGDAEAAAEEGADAVTEVVAPAPEPGVPEPGPPDRAEPTAGSAKWIQAVRVPRGSIRVDGRLDEEAWAAAVFVSDFRQKGTDRSFAPREHTEVAFLYDDRALYVGARMKLSRPSDLRRRVGRREDPGIVEQLLVSLDTYRDRRTAYTFGVTAGGVRVDHFHSRDRESARDDSFNPVWRARVGVDSAGWTAEMRIPFSQLRFSGGDEQVWGLNIRRWNPATFVNVYWVVIPRYETGWASRFGELVGLSGISGSGGVEVVPYVLGRATFLDDRLGVPESREMETRVGADLKAGLARNVTLAATFNPDFGQVEADPAQVNLTAFETFFPERRPFFLEGSQLFRTPGPNYFYSRRIGSVPRSAIPADLLEDVEGATILGAAKLTGRLPSGLSVGGLAAVTDRERALLVDRGPALPVDSAFIDADGGDPGQELFPDPGPVEVAPRTAFAVMRIQQEVGASASSVGLMITGVERFMSPGGSLTASLTRRAVAGGMDWTARFGGGQHEMAGYAGFSHVAGDTAAIRRLQVSSAHFFQRPDASHVRLDGDRTSLSGYSAGLSLGKFGGAHWFWDLGISAESPGFEIRDAGSQVRADRIHARASLRYAGRSPRGSIRGHSVGLALTSGWNFGGVRRYVVPNLFTNVTWSNLWSTSLEVGVNTRGLSDDLTRGGPLMETPRGGWANLGISSRSTSPVWWSLSLGSFLDEFGGWSAAVNTGFTVRGGRRLEFSLHPGYTRGLDSRQFVMTVEEGGRPETFGRRHVFAFLERSEAFAQLRVNFAFAPSAVLSFYAEPFVSSGRFQSFGELEAPRSRTVRRYGTDGTFIRREEDGSRTVTDGEETFTLPNLDFRVRSFRSNAVFRWEWSPGSALHLIWQRSRFLFGDVWTPSGAGELFRTLGDPGENILLAKMSLRLGFD